MADPRVVEWAARAALGSQSQPRWALSPCPGRPLLPYANRRSGKPEGWDDAVPALSPLLDHRLLEQRFPLARRPVEHCFPENLFHVGYDLGGLRDEHFGAVGFPQVFQQGRHLSNQIDDDRP